MPRSLPNAVDALAAADDPRLNADFWRVVPGSDGHGAAVVVGVVHDHPASSYRVGAVAEAVDPDTVALELPDLAVPSFERIAREADEGEAEPTTGGEMTAAIAASPDADVVGVDTVGPRFLRRLAANARAEGASPTTVRHALAEVAGIARHALACRVGGVTGDDGPTRRAAADHDVSAADTLAAQADDERTHVARSRALLGAVERPHADLLLDGTREGNMAARIDVLREEGSVLAVVGMDHLDSVAARMT